MHVSRFAGISTPLYVFSLNDLTKMQRNDQQKHDVTDASCACDSAEGLSQRSARADTKLLHTHCHGEIQGRLSHHALFEVKTKAAKGHLVDENQNRIANSTIKETFSPHISHTFRKCLLLLEQIQMYFCVSVAIDY